MNATKRGRTGRPRRSEAETSGASPNRERILDAATQEFAARGFRATTLRSIAASAGVDVALIAHYYGNKEGLFAATLRLPSVAATLVPQALAAPPGVQGDRLTRAYLGLWEDDETGAKLRALARSTLSDDRARQSIEEALLGALSVPETHALLAGRRVGFALAMAILLGVALQRHLLPGSPTSALSFDALVARVAPAVALQLSTPDA